MLIDHKHKLIFISTPKTASTSIGHVLCKSGADDPGINIHTKWRDAPAEDLVGYVSFAVVRELEAWAKSLFRFAYGTGLWEMLRHDWCVSFKNNDTYQDFRSRLTATPSDWTDGVDEVFEFEDLGRLEKWLARFYGPITLPHFNSYKEESL